jgi:hypothetical protein
MREKLFTLHYKQLTGGGDTGEPEKLTDCKATDLTKEQLESLTYSLENGDFGCSFCGLRAEEQ